MITGIAGHGGVYFCQLLLEKEYVVYGTSHHTSSVNPVKAKAKLGWDPQGYRRATMRHNSGLT